MAAALRLTSQQAEIINGRRLKNISDPLELKIYYYQNLPLWQAVYFPPILPKTGVVGKDTINA